MIINKNHSAWNATHNVIVPTNKARRPGIPPGRIFDYPVEDKLKTEQKRIDDLVKKIVDFPVEQISPVMR